MNASIFWENPGWALVGVLAVIFLFLLLPIVAAIRRTREERSRQSLRVQEPRICNDRYDDDQEYSYERHDFGNYYNDDRDQRSSDRWSARDDCQDESAAGAFGSGPQKRKPVRLTGPARGVWFVVGVCVGAASMALWRDPPRASTLMSLFAPFEIPNPPAITYTPVVAAETKTQVRLDPIYTAQLPPTAAVGNAEIGAMVDAFVTNLRTQLPMAVSPAITMTTVDAGQNVIALGFEISQMVADEDALKLQSELETRFRHRVCAAKPQPSNIRGLNERGVPFLIAYTDQIGKNVARLTIEPRFCSNPP